jgi:hypothetical protein
MSLFKRGKWVLDGWCCQRCPVSVATENDQLARSQEKRVSCGNKGLPGYFTLATRLPRCDLGKLLRTLRKGSCTQPKERMSQIVTEVFH